MVFAFMDEKLLINQIFLLWPEVEVTKKKNP